MIWHEGMDGWLPAASIPELSSLLRQIPPPLRKAPPPLDRNADAKTTGTQAPVVPIYSAPSKPSNAAGSIGQGLKLEGTKKWGIGAGAIALTILLFVGYRQTTANSQSNPADSSYGGMTTAPQAALLTNSSSTPKNSHAIPPNESYASILADSSNTGSSLTIQAAQEQQAAADAEAKEARRSWNREHFLEYVSAVVLSKVIALLLGYDLYATLVRQMRQRTYSAQRQ